MTYLLDSNVVIALLKQNHRVAEQMRRHPVENLCTSCIAIHGLPFGAFKSNRAKHNLSMIGALRYTILDFQPEDARVAGKVRADLERKGTPIGPYDTLIAGQALARDLTLVTRNTREFERVSGLRVEDWEG